MKLIVGLGNPGDKYQATRHNLGFMALDELARRAEARWSQFSATALTAKLVAQDAMLLKPYAFMNESGKGVSEVVSYFKIPPQNIWVVHDDLDLPPGRIKIDFAASAAGHRGVQSVIDELGSQNFWRWRIGIGRPPEQLPPDVFVLQPMIKVEQVAASDTTLNVADLVTAALINGMEYIRNQSGN